MHSTARLGLLLLAAGSQLPAWALVAQEAPDAPPCDAVVAALATKMGLAPVAATGLRDGLEAHGGVVIRWSTNGAPIRVWIQPRHAALGSEVERFVHWPAVVRRAADAWNEVVPSIEFAGTPDSADAVVRVVWARRLRPTARAEPADMEPPGVGRTILSRDSADVIREALVVLAEEGARGARLGPGAVHAVALHEFGHVLGLMHRRGSPAMAASARAGWVDGTDRAVLRGWYALPPGALCRP